MFRKIGVIKELGYNPSSILDIGAYKGLWTRKMKKLYPESKYYLFEANSYSELDMLKEDINNIIYQNTVLNDKVEEIEWYENKFTGDSFCKEKSVLYMETKPIKRETIDLDTIIKRDDILKDDGNIFVKIDCQGAEIPILKGMNSILKRTDFIVLEIPLFGQYNENVPSFLEHIQFMDSIGFIIYDILEEHYINHFTPLKI
jgi:FkbM family methyltransferase